MIYFIVLLSSVFSWGYSFTPDFKQGFYWSQLPLEFIVVEKDSARRARLENLVEESINEWQSQVASSIWNFFPGINSGVKNIIRWSNRFDEETGMDVNSILAITIRNISGPYIVKSEIVINGEHSITSNDYFLRTILIHEFGHTVGLDHSEEPDAVMAPSLQVMYSGLHSDDVQGMSAVVNETHRRQSIGYISPLSVEQQFEERSPFSCGMTSQIQPSPQGIFTSLLSLIAGLLSTFVYRFSQFFKSIFRFPKRKSWKKNKN